MSRNGWKVWVHRGLLGQKTQRKNKGKNGRKGQSSKEMMHLEPNEILHIFLTELLVSFHPGLVLTLSNDVTEYLPDLNLEPGFVMSLNHKPCPECFMEYSKKIFVPDSLSTTVGLKQVS